MSDGLSRAGSMGFARLIIFLILIAIVVGILTFLGLQASIPCGIAGVKILVGLEEYNPRNLVGTNVSFQVEGFEGCTPEQERIIHNWLPQIYDNLDTGCLDDVDLPTGIHENEIDRRVLRNKMIALMTCSSLEIICDHPPICGQAPGLAGYTHGPILDAGRNQFYICFQNRPPNAILSPTVAHELGHIALYHTHPRDPIEPQIWRNEDLAGNIGVSCGDIR